MISVVICTRGRSEQLERCLASLNRQSDPDFEILIVDNNDAPTFGHLAGPRVRVVHEPVRGLDVARNRGIAEATGDVVAFIDDDCEAHPYWTKEVRRAFVSAAGVAMITGRVLPANLATPAERWFERLSSFDRGGRPRRYMRPMSHPLSLDGAGALGTGCNMAFRKTLFDRVGRFDEAIDMGTPVGGGGDIDMFARVLAAGYDVRYEPEALVRHYHRVTLPSLVRQLFGYGASVGALSFKFSRITRRHIVANVRYQLLWLNWIVASMFRGPRGRILVGAFLTAALVAGDIYGPFAYLRSQRVVRRRERNRARPLLRLAHSRDVVRELIVRDIRLRYRRSALGIAWSQIGPLLTMLVLTVIFTRLIPLGVENYALFVFIGLSSWQWFQNGLTSATSTVVTNRDLIRQPSLRPAVLPAVAVGTQFAYHLLALPVVFGAVAFATGGVSVATLFLPWIYAAQFALCLGLAYPLARLHVTLRDTSEIVGVVLRLAFYATPIIYDEARLLASPFRVLYDVNPLAHLITAQRSVLLYGRWPDVGALAVISLGAFALLLIGSRVFSSGAHRYAEEV
jgi:lipopolysaccharide transport system permease protein